jgi:hypothetical protein
LKNLLRPELVGQRTSHGSRLTRFGGGDCRIVARNFERIHIGRSRPGEKLMTTSTEDYSDVNQRRPGAWAVGLTVFASAIMITTGLFQVLAGIVALVDDKFYVRTRNYTYEFDTTTWGWIHLLVGALVVLVGIGVLSGATWARVVGIALVVLSMIENFLFLPHYPFWSLLIIALDVAVIWALSQSMSPGRR